MRKVSEKIAEIEKLNEEEISISRLRSTCSKPSTRPKAAITKGDLTACGFIVGRPGYRARHSPGVGIATQIVWSKPLNACASSSIFDNFPEHLRRHAVTSKRMSRRGAWNGGPAFPPPPTRCGPSCAIRQAPLPEVWLPLCRPLAGSFRPFFFLGRQGVVCRACAAHFLVGRDKSTAQLPVLLKLGHFPLGFALGSRGRKTLGDCLAARFIGEPGVGAVPFLARLMTVTVGIAAALRGGNGTTAKVAQSRNRGGDSRRGVFQVVARTRTRGRLSFAERIIYAR